MSSENRSPGPMLTRRNALKAGAGAGAATLGLSGVGVPNELEMAQDAEAVPPLIIYGAGVAGAAATTWALHELDVWGAQDAADGLGPNTLQTVVYQNATRRKSVVDSTIVDNTNIIGYMDETAFSEGKLAALEAIKDGKTKTEAATAGQDAAKSHMATVEGNFIRSWNEAVKGIVNQYQQVQSHDNLTVGDVFTVLKQENGDYYAAFNGADADQTLTLRDGSSITVKTWQYDSGYPPVAPMTPWDDSYDSMPHSPVVKHPDGTNQLYWEGYNLADMWNNMQTKFDEILNNISLWLDNTYDQIQTGDISPGEYLSGVDVANTIAEDDNRALAIGDLISMNIPGDYDHETTIQLEGDNAKVVGFLAYSGSDSTPTLNAGTTIEPSTFSGTWYLAYRPGTYIEEWTDYDSSYGIQGGEVHFTSDPTSKNGFNLSSDVAYVVGTTHDEQAKVHPSDFTETTDENSNTIWTVDLSGQLEQTITDVAQIRRIYDGDSPDTYTSMVLDQTATILEVEGTDSLTIQQNRDPQTDTNYITESEWQQILDQQQELIDEYETADSGGGGGWSPSFDVPFLGPLDSIEDWGLAAVAAVVGSAVFGNLS